MLPHASDRIVRYPPGLLDVPGYLLLELLHAREPLLGPYPPYQANIHHAPVEVPPEPDHVGLDATLAAPEGRGHPDVDAGRMYGPPVANEPGVDPVRRDDHGRMREHVRGREAYTPPPPVAYDHLASEYVRSEEHTSELQSRQYLVCRLLLEKKTEPARRRALSVS